MSLSVNNKKLSKLLIFMKVMRIDKKNKKYFRDL